MLALKDENILSLPPIGINDFHDIILHFRFSSDTKLWHKIHAIRYFEKGRSHLLCPALTSCFSEIDVSGLNKTTHFKAFYFEFLIFKGLRVNEQCFKKCIAQTWKASVCISELYHKSWYKSNSHNTCSCGWIIKCLVHTPIKYTCNKGMQRKNWLSIRLQTLQKRAVSLTSWVWTVLVRSSGMTWSASVECHLTS